MIDTFYNEVEENGLKFYLRYTDLQRPDGRTLEVPDELEIKAKVEKEEEEKEEKRDITYDEFKDLFEAHIEGKVEKSRTIHDSDDENAGAKVENKSRTQSKGTMSKKGSKLDYDGEYDAKSNYSKEEVRSRVTTSDKMSKSVTSHNTMNITANQFKFELPESCFISMMKKVKIEKLNSKFYLVSHPFPQIEGEMLIFQPKKDDQSEEDLIVYRDYSLRKRIPTAEKTAGLMKRKAPKAEEEIDAKL